MPPPSPILLRPPERRVEHDEQREEFEPAEQHGEAQDALREVG